MSKPLSTSQQKIYDFMVSYQSDRGYPPSVREICKGVGLSSTSTVHGHLGRLEKKGLILRDPSKPRAVMIADIQDRKRGQVSLPIVGNVTAGVPILAREEIEGYLSLPLDMAKSEDSFVLTVSGESMIDAGILNGDKVIVQPNVQIENGDIVVAMIEEESSDDVSATVKRFFKEKDRIRLQPENPSMQPIFVKDAIIIGKVIGLIRKF